MEGIPIDLDKAQLKFEEGKRCLKAGQRKEAELAFREAVKHNPHLGKAWFHIALLLEDQPSKTREAEDAFQVALRCDPQDPTMWANLGYMYFELWRMREAAEAWQRALSLAPTGWPLKREIESRLSQLNHAALARVAEKSRTWYERGKQLIKSNQLLQAETALREATRLDPSFANAWLHLGILIQNDKERMVEARDAFILAVQWDPVNPLSWVNLGRSLVTLGSVQESREAFQRALSLAPTEWGLRAEVTKSLFELASENAQTEEKNLLKKEIPMPLSVEIPEVTTTLEVKPEIPNRQIGECKPIPVDAPASGAGVMIEEQIPVPTVPEITKLPQDDHVESQVPEPVLPELKRELPPNSSETGATLADTGVMEKQTPVSPVPEVTKLPQDDNVEPRVPEPMLPDLKRELLSESSETEVTSGDTGKMLQNSTMVSGEEAPATKFTEGIVRGEPAEEIEKAEASIPAERHTSVHNEGIELEENPKTVEMASQPEIVEKGTPDIDQILPNNPQNSDSETGEIAENALAPEGVKSFPSEEFQPVTFEESIPEPTHFNAPKPVTKCPLCFEEIKDGKCTFCGAWVCHTCGEVNTPVEWRCKKCSNTRV